MNSVSTFLSIIVLAGLGLPLTSGQPPKTSAQPAVEIGKPEEFARLDRIVLEKAGLKSDRGSLEAFVTSICGDDKELLQISKLIDGLDDPQFRVREDRAKRLKSLGLAAVPALERAAASTSITKADNARTCLEAIHEAAKLHVSAAAVRELGKHKEPSAVAALLRYLPYAGEHQATAIYYSTLAAVEASSDSAADLAKGLADPVPARRAMAACTLGSLPGGKWRDRVRPLLEDKDPLVKLRAAQGLLAGGDITGVATLISLVEASDLMVRFQAIALLDWLMEGDDKAPPVPAYANVEEPAKLREKLAKWWAGKNETGSDVFKQARRTIPGLTLAVIRDFETFDWRTDLVTMRGRTVWSVVQKGRVEVARMSESGLLHSSTSYQDQWKIVDSKDFKNTRGGSTGGLVRLSSGVWVNYLDRGQNALELRPFSEQRKAVANGTIACDQMACDESGMCIGVSNSRTQWLAVAFLCRERKALLSAGDSNNGVNNFVDSIHSGLARWRLHAMAGTFSYRFNSQTIICLGPKVERIKLPGQVQAVRVVGHHADSISVFALTDKGRNVTLRVNWDGKVLAEQVWPGESGIDSMQVICPVLDVGFSRHFQKNDLASPETYLALLGSKLESDRLRALAGLRAILETQPSEKEESWKAEATNAMLFVLGQQRSTLTEAASEVLSRLGDGATAKMIETLKTTDNVTLRGNVTGSLIRYIKLNEKGSRKLIPTLLEMADATDKAYRMNAFGLLGSFKDDAAVSDFLVRASKSHDEQTRLRALSLLRSGRPHANENAVKALCIDLLKRPDAEIKIVLMLFMSREHLVPEALALAEKLSSSKDAGVRDWAERVVRKHKSQ